MHGLFLLRFQGTGEALLLINCNRRVKHIKPCRALRQKWTDQHGNPYLSNLLEAVQ